MSDKGTANLEAEKWQLEAEKWQLEAEKWQLEAATFNWADLLPIGLALLILFGAFGFLMWKKPDKFTTIRINLLWVSTLVAILTLVFGHQLIELLRSNPKGDTETVKVVLSSLVGVGIGGLIALAGQLVQDFDEKSTKTEPPAQDSGEKPAKTEPPAQDSGEKSTKTEPPAQDSGEKPAKTEPPAQDSGEKSTKTEPPAQDSGEKPAKTEPPAQDSGEKPAKTEPPANGQENN